MVNNSTSHRLLIAQVSCRQKVFNLCLGPILPTCRTQSQHDPEQNVPDFHNHPSTAAAAVLFHQLHRGPRPDPIRPKICSTILVQLLLRRSIGAVCSEGRLNKSVAETAGARSQLTSATFFLIVSRNAPNLLCANQVRECNFEVVPGDPN